eukprot:745165-Pyramimonas_sp.AAC.2
MHRRVLYCTVSEPRSEHFPAMLQGSTSRLIYNSLPPYLRGSFRGTMSSAFRLPRTPALPLRVPLPAAP